MPASPLSSADPAGGQPPAQSPGGPGSEPELPEKIIRRRGTWVALDLRELWLHRDILYILAWRDLLVRYKQTALGIGWAILQPVLTTIVFTVLFGKMAGFNSHAAPYILIAFAAILPWQLFVNALGDSSASVVASASMIAKVYFPRLLIPASAVGSGLADFLVSLAVMAGFLVWYQVPLQPRLFCLPVFILLTCLTAFAYGLWLSALNVRFRDVKYIVPFFTRLGLYVSPVGFLSSVVLEKFGATAYFVFMLNPMAGIIEGFRWCLLGAAFAPDWRGLAVSTAITLVVLVFGAYFFRRTEQTFADLI